MSFTPTKAAQNSLDRSRAILKHATDPAVPLTLVDDLVRAALVMAVAALDSYLHAAVMRTLKPWKPQPELARHSVRFDELCKLADVISEADRPWVRVKKLLRAQLQKVSFQSPSSVESALQMCGVNKPWSKIATERNLSQESLKGRLGKIVHRRNKIVHEGDLKRFERPQAVRLEAVDAAEVRRDITWLDKLIHAIDKVV